MLDHTEYIVGWTADKIIDKQSTGWTADNFFLQTTVNSYYEIFFKTIILMFNYTILDTVYLKRYSSVQNKASFLAL